MDGESKITNEIGMQMCKFWFDSIIAKLEKKKLPNFDDFGIPNDKYPLFVTWLIGKNKDLRGCIGTFSEQSISKNLQKYALISAFQDSRFDPISKGEVKKLNCGVSLLCNFQDIDDPLDWVVGKHGIEIDFEHDGEKYSATFLPEVAEEENWNQEETLEYLVSLQLLFDFIYIGENT